MEFTRKDQSRVASRADKQLRLNSGATVWNANGFASASTFATARNHADGEVGERKDSMTHQTSPYRVYFGPEDDATTATATANPGVQHKVTVPLGEILPVLADAIKQNRMWLNDFEEEQLTISMDLYEVLLAYEHYRRPSA